MKIIHCADIHLGSKMKSFPQSVRERREREIFETFNSLIEYANTNSIKNILLAGDIFDRDVPLEREKREFYGAVKKNPQINFYYLRGNHDGGASYKEECENLKTFNGEWTSYSLGENVALYGLEISEENKKSMYSDLKTNPQNVNIVMLHGNSGFGSGEINLNYLKDKNIDYLALGHIHSFKSEKLDARGVYAYSGCLEGRGFDETGVKGFAVYDTQSRKAEFVPFSKRVIELHRVCVTGAKDFTDIKNTIIREVPPDIGKPVRVELFGEIEFIESELESELEDSLARSYYALSVKDLTRLVKDYHSLENESSLLGEFVRLTLKEEFDEEDGEEIRQQILKKGVDVLSGGKR